LVVFDSVGLPKNLSDIAKQTMHAFFDSEISEILLRFFVVADLLRFCFAWFWFLLIILIAWNKLLDKHDA